MKKNIQITHTFLLICFLFISADLFAGVDAPRLFLLSIGATPPAIQYTVEDALDFAQTFENQANKSGIYSKVITKTLTGEYANAENIKEEINALSQEKKVKSGDLIVLFISSHGFIDGDGNFQIEASDYSSSGSQNSVHLYEMLRLLETSKARKLIFMDVCSSNANARKNSKDTMTDYYTVPPSASTKNISRHSVPRKHHKIKLVDYNKYTGTTIVTSSIGGTYSYYHDTWRNGAFTEALIEGFNGRADSDDDQTITIGEIFEYIELRIPQLCKEQRIKNVQRPDLFRNGLGNSFPIFSSQYQLQTRNSRRQLSHLLNIQPAEPASQTKWIHNSEDLFNAPERLITGVAAFTGKGDSVHLKIKTTTQGDFRHYYNTEQPPTLRLHFNNGKQVELNGIEHFAMYSKKHNETTHIITFATNENKEKMIAQYPLEAITMNLQAGAQKYTVNHSNTLKKQLNLVEMARKGRLIPSKSDKKDNKKL